jgi:acetyltransferase-like isoleucine patch superfamily enzyme
MTLGKGCKISSFTKIKAASGPLRIGARTSIATGCFIGAGASGTTIGDDCLIGPNCTILSGAYRYTDLNATFSDQGRDSKGTRIGNNVLIGANSVVVDGSEIGDNVMISAQSFVSGKIPTNAVVQGNPAQVIFVRR